MRAAPRPPRRASAPDLSGMQTGRFHCVIEMRSRGSTHRHRSLAGSPTRPGPGRYRGPVPAPLSDAAPPFSGGLDSCCRPLQVDLRPLQADDARPVAALDFFPGLRRTPARCGCQPPYAMVTCQRSFAVREAASRQRLWVGRRQPAFGNCR